MDDLEKTLSKVYYGGVDSRLQRMTVDYINQHPSVYKKPFKFVSKLVRLIDYILRKNPEILIGHLSRILSYNAEGLEKLSLGQTDDIYTKEEVKRFKAAFHHNMGVIVRRMYHEKIFADCSHDELLREWYEHMRIAADTIEPHMTKKKAAAYGLAGDAAYLLFKSFGGEWQNIALECYKLFLEYYKKEPDPGLSNVAQMVMKKIAQLSRKQS